MTVEKSCVEWKSIEYQESTINFNSREIHPFYLWCPGVVVELASLLNRGCGFESCTACNEKIIKLSVRKATNS